MGDEQLNAASNSSDAATEADVATEAATRWSMVGITDETQQNIGTGTLVRWKGCHLILTAEHVIGKTRSEDLRFLFPPDSPPIEITRETLLALRRLTAVPRQAVRASSKIKSDRLVRDTKLDLAAIEVEAGLDKDYPVRFFDLTEGGRTPTEGRETIITGFPWDISRPTNQNVRLVFPQSEWTSVASNREGLSGFDPAKHFLALYNWAETYPEAKPQGISGAAMWFRLGATAVVWHSNLDIAGVATDWYPRVRLLKMVRREVVEEFLTAMAA
jgi:hypothetical protein